MANNRIASVSQEIASENEQHVFVVRMLCPLHAANDKECMRGNGLR